MPEEATQIKRKNKKKQKKKEKKLFFLNILYNKISTWSIYFVFYLNGIYYLVHLLNGKIHIAILLFIR